MDFVKLTCPTGPIYLKRESVVVLTVASNSKTSRVKTLLWMDGQNEEFNILEDVDTVRELLTTYD